MRVLVIGGTSFIGPYVVRRLVEAGCEVKIFNRGKTRAGLPESVERIFGDRRRLADHASELRRLAPEVVLDMVPMNERDARDVKSIFGGIARRIVAVSSQDVYRAYNIVRGKEPGPPDPVPLDEDAPLREELFPYRGEKLEGADEYEKILVEKVVMGNSGPPSTVLRLPVVYGPGDYQHRLFPYLKRMDDGRPAILLEEGLDRWRWTPGYVENVAGAIALAVANERALGGIYNVGEPVPLPWTEWIKEIGRVAGWYGEIVAVPENILPTHLRRDANYAQHLVVNTSLIRRELDYHEKVPRKEALHRTIEWERAHPPEDIDPQEFDYAAEDVALTGLNR